MHSVAGGCLPSCAHMDCTPPGSSVHGIFQARILEWVAIALSRRSSQPRDQTCVSRVSCIAGGFFPAESPGRNVILFLQQNESVISTPSSKYSIFFHLTCGAIFNHMLSFPICNWLLNNTGLNCEGLLIYRLFLINIYYITYDPWLVVSTEVELWTQRANCKVIHRLHSMYSYPQLLR